MSLSKYKADGIGSKEKDYVKFYLPATQWSIIICGIIQETAGFNLRIGNLRNDPSYKIKEKCVFVCLSIFSSQ